MCYSGFKTGRTHCLYLDANLGLHTADTGTFCASQAFTSCLLPPALFHLTTMSSITCRPSHCSHYYLVLYGHDSASWDFTVLFIATYITRWPLFISVPSFTCCCCLLPHATCTPAPPPVVCYTMDMPVASNPTITCCLFLFLHIYSLRTTITGLPFH